MKQWTRRFAQCVAALCVAGCASVPVTVALRNPGFEDEPYPGRPCPMGWDCIMHAGGDSFRFFDDESAPARGKRSLCIEPLTREPWAIASQGLFDIAQMRGSRVRFSVAVRLDAITGNGAGPFASTQDGHGVVIARASRLLRGTQAWQRVEVDLEVPPAAALVEVGVTLEGRGRVCLDDARLEIRGTPKSPV